MSWNIKTPGDYINGPLTVIGSATITGDLTVDTSTLKVDSALNKVGVGVATLTGLQTFNVAGDVGITSDLVLKNSGGTVQGYIFGSSGLNYRVIAGQPHVWQEGGSDLMRLNSTGLGVGTTVQYARLTVTGSNATGIANIQNSPFASNTGGSLSCYIGHDGTANRPFIQSATGNAGSAFDLLIQPYGGNVGIGVTPSAWTTSYNALNIGSGGSIAAYKSANYDQFYVGSNFFENTSGAWRFINNGYATQYWHNSGSHVWRISTTSNAAGANQPLTWTQAMTLDASGRLLVGTTSQPSGVSNSVATFKSTSADWSSVIWNSNAVPFGLRIQHDTDVNGSSNQFLFCYGASTVRAELRSNGGLANYQANNVNLSDIRTKTDIKPLASYWNKIKSIELVTFKYKDQTHSDDNIGLIAQQVESVAPELVDVDGFGETPDDGVPIKTIYTTDLYHAAIKALQEAMTRIEALESKLA